MWDEHSHTRLGGKHIDMLRKWMENTMDKNRVEGKAKQVEGRVQNVAGAVTDDLGEQVAGKAKEAAGKIQEEFGKAKDEMRHETRRANRA